MTASPNANPTPGPGRPEPGEEFFRQSIADLTKRLGERAARESTSELQSAAEARRRAMKAYERERARKLRLILTGAGAVFVTAGFVWAVVILGEPETLPASASQIADVQSAPTPAPPVATAAATPVVMPPQPAEPRSAPAAVTESQPPSAPVPSAPVQVDPPSTPPPQIAAAPPSAPPQQAEPATTTAPPTPSLLGREEIREVQKRLRGFGFNPGPADGVAGRQTEVATQRYLETRGQPQMPPTDPQLLDQLRQDPAPQVAPSQTAQRAGWSDTAQASQAQPARRSFDPFQPVKVAGTEITRFLQSVFR